jgi:hypothetical protein
VQKKLLTSVVHKGVLLCLQIITHLMYSFRPMPHPCRILVRAAVLHYNAPTLNLTSTIATPLTLFPDVRTTMATTDSRCPVLAYINTRLLAFLSSPLTCHLVGTCSYNRGILLSPPAHNTLSGTMWRQVKAVFSESTAALDRIYKLYYKNGIPISNSYLVKNAGLEKVAWVILSLFEARGPVLGKVAG